LEKMLTGQRDQVLVNRLIERVGGMARDAAAEPAYSVVQWINQTGQFKRYQADRAIHIDPELSPMDRQRKEIERDLVNVRWLADAAEHVGGLLEKAGEKLVRGAWVEGGEEVRGASGRAGMSSDIAVHGVANGCAGPGEARKLWVIAHVDTERGNLGKPRDLTQEIAPGVNLLRAMLARLARCRRVAGVVLMAADVVVVRELVGRVPAGLTVEIEQIDAGMLRDRLRGVGIGRLWARHCWRGGLANLSCYDEAVVPRVAGPVMERRGIEAAAFIGASWSVVDPALVDAVIERHFERPDAHELTFAHAPPGLGACVVSRRVVQEIAAANSPLASVGGLIGYLPHAPQMDPIAKPVCVSVEPRVRDLLLRCIPDSRERLAMLRSALGSRVLTASASEIADGLAGYRGPVEHLTVCASAYVRGEAIERIVRAGSRVAVTVVDDGYSLAEALRLVTVCRGAGSVGVHLRTPLVDGVPAAQDVIANEADVVSIDVLAEGGATYQALTGRKCFEQVREGVAHLLEHRRMVEGMPSLWVVPRITRRDAVYEQVEDFYTRGLVTADWCVIDPLPAVVDGERIVPLPIPDNVRRRLAWSTRVIGGDGVVRDGCGERVEMDEVAGVGVE